eukprot:CAMPEP_0175028320 /NCGR_PEP_ID=MMETSP0005-20121125/18928_1 /TAXON_ID=420556 /ORGANISM="Ochromonas sp., Strain CCMP1393" /LENGTH=79 /DNA_ID=CAMNT_0016287913 /DNA_START=274 /DNA_END=510 /DNA_ORIENTATION=+
MRQSQAYLLSCIETLPVEYLHVSVSTGIQLVQADQRLVGQAALRILADVVDPHGASRHAQRRGRTCEDQAAQSVQRQSG